MQTIEIHARPSVKDLDELRGMAIGEPFAGRIHWPDMHLKPYFFLKTEEPKGDNYSFLTLPTNNELHRVDVAGVDIQFFDAMMTGNLQPFFVPPKARVTTFVPTGAEYKAVQESVFRSLKLFYESVSRGLAATSGR